MTIYVNMTDKALSGWGPARNGRSILCIECETRAQADAIEAAAWDRREMRNVTRSDKPRRGRNGDVVTLRRFADMGGPWLKYWRPEGWERH